MEKNEISLYQPPATNAGFQPLIEELTLDQSMTIVQGGFGADEIELLHDRTKMDASEIAGLLGMEKEGIEKILSGSEEAVSSEHYRIYGAGSDRVHEVLRVTDLAIEVLGSVENCARWFQSPRESLSGKSPSSVLGIAEGRRRVCDLLYAIEQGQYS